MTRKERIDIILSHFSAQQPEITTELEFASVFQLLCAVVLSAQCTDKRVNQVTPELFRHYPTPHAMADATPDEILEYISSVSYPNSKAKHLAALAQRLCSDFNGEVPDNMDDLTSLPGVGRKTANVMLAVAFDRPAMPVDTHVYRVSHRLKLVPATATTPVLVEKSLVKLIPPHLLSRAHHWLLLHGRYICTSRSPHCKDCCFNTICPSSNVNMKEKGA